VINDRAFYVERTDFAALNGNPIAGYVFISVYATFIRRIFCDYGDVAYLAIADSDFTLSAPYQDDGTDPAAFN